MHFWGHGMRVVICLVFSVLLLIATEAATVKKVEKHMGSRFEITAVATDGQQAEQAIAAAYAEIERIEAMISSWRETSHTSDVNRNAGEVAVVVPDELFGLIHRSLKVSELTDGAFDITFASYGHLWNFKVDPPVLPTEQALAAAKEGVGYQHIVLDKEAKTVFLNHRKTKIGFGAIGKGYAANRAVMTLKKFGVESGLVNAGGDLMCFGKQEDGEPWSVVIANPRARDQVFARLKIGDQSIVTSGDYENFFIHQGKRYGHIINPKTGYPVEEVVSATIICPDAELADALATSVSVLGVVEGMALVERIKNVEAVLVDVDGQVHFSQNIQSMMLSGEEAL